MFFSVFCLLSCDAVSNKNFRDYYWKHFDASAAFWSVGKVNSFVISLRNFAGMCGRFTLGSFVFFWTWIEADWLTRLSDVNLSVSVRFYCVYSVSSHQGLILLSLSECFLSTESNETHCFFLSDGNIISVERQCSYKSFILFSVFSFSLLNPAQMAKSMWTPQISTSLLCNISF